MLVGMGNFPLFKEFSPILISIEEDTLQICQTQKMLDCQQPALMTRTG
jgi:hypothetical protein